MITFLFEELIKTSGTGETSCLDSLKGLVKVFKVVEDGERFVN